jgi:hypothetical protein
MHLEFLLEEQSMEAALLVLVPKMAPATRLQAYLPPLAPAGAP